MGSTNHHEEDSITSSEEVELQEEQESCNEVISTRRSYKCVFCKRGFTTAQALGGHMNIHRKYRAKNKPSSTVNPRNHDRGNCPSPIIYQPISRFTPSNYMAAGGNNEAQVIYTTYFLAASTSNTTATANPLFETHKSDNHHINPSNPFGEDWRLGFNLEFGVAAADTEGVETKKKRIGSDVEEELDLELRLGHHP